MLVEKMVNTKAVLESPHLFTSFNPVQYLVKTHKVRFGSLRINSSTSKLPICTDVIGNNHITSSCCLIGVQGPTLRNFFFFMQAAFQAVMHLWNKKPLKVYGERMSESILAILCHIFKGHSTIKEQLEKEKEEQSKSGATTSTGAGAGASSSLMPLTTLRPEEPTINQEHLQQVRYDSQYY